LALDEELLKLERRFWETPADRLVELYREALTNEALLVLPDPTGLINKAQCIEIFESAGDTWSDYEIDDPRVVELGEDSALITYLAVAARESDVQPYRARISSVYVRNGEHWLLAFHQQTPRSAAGDEDLAL
jgi:hypothetical protein